MLVSCSSSVNLIGSGAMVMTCADLRTASSDQEETQSCDQKELDGRAVLEKPVDGGHNS